MKSNARKMQYSNTKQTAKLTDSHTALVLHWQWGDKLMHSDMKQMSNGPYFSDYYAVDGVEDGGSAEVTHVPRRIPLQRHEPPRVHAPGQRGKRRRGRRQEEPHGHQAGHAGRCYEWFTFLKTLLWIWGLNFISNKIPYWISAEHWIYKRFRNFIIF